MFKYTRESLFSHEDVLKLDYIKEDEIKKYFVLLSTIELHQAQLNDQLKVFSKICYEEGKQERLKQVLKFRRTVQSRKISQIPDMLPKTITDLAQIFSDNLTKFNELKRIIKNEFFSNNYSYNYFLENQNFQQAIKYTNPKAFTQVFDEAKYQKGKYQKTRYSYIQRNILKTNSISWMGLTSFDVEGTGEIQERTILNQYFVTALIFLAANDPQIRKKMKFTLGEFADREGITCYIQRLYYVSLLNNSFLSRENMLFKESIVQLLQEIKAKNVFTGEELEVFLSQREQSIEFFQKNYLLIPDFEYYSQGENLLQLLNKSEIFRIIALQILESNSVDRNNMLTLTASDVSYLEELDTYYFDKSILEILKNEPIWINLVSKIGTSKAVSIFETNFKDYDELQECVNAHDQYSKIVQLIKKYSSSDLRNVLDVFFKIEAEMIYRESYWYKKESTSQNIKIKDDGFTEEKTYLVMFNVDKCGEVFLTNVYPGNGFLLGREFDKVTDQSLSLLEEYINNNLGSEKKIYEVVIEPEISALINTGKTSYSKLYWPDDFKEVKVIYDKGIKFFYKNSEIKPIYFGSVPIHMFHGAKGLFLKAISPWGMSQNVSNQIGKINERESLLFTRQILESCLKKDSFETYLNILDYFEERGFPLKFFVQETGFGIHKPMYISLLNKEGYELFVNAVKNNDVRLTTLNPNPDTYKSNEKLFEHINIITEREIVDHVEKLSHL
ncbi:hypothetical protein IGI37_000249 [Enterococcus sp. AZ194]|uniref:hypothetical protein n=1 Tax=Enterococcus sp. AZ194 TaxID=2774629 RepID=UPI003F27790C